MSKGDHIFNNVVSKLTKSFHGGLIECIRGTKSNLRGGDRHKLVNDSPYRDAWMRRHMPRTWAALEYIKDHPDLVVLREKLQTSSYVGGDINNKAYSDAAQEFEAAVAEFFKKLANGRSQIDANTLLPDVNAVRRTFYHMAAQAEDPGALARMLEQYKEQPRERSQIESEIEQVRQSMRWAWGRCEQLFRIASQEFPYH